MTQKREKPLHLDMSFDEALRRVAQTDPRELKGTAKAAKKRKKTKSKVPSRVARSADKPEQS